MICKNDELAIFKSLFSMDSITLCLSSSSLPKPPKFPQIPQKNPNFTSLNPNKTLKIQLKTPLILLSTLNSPNLPTLASESPQFPERINLEATLISIDDFFNKYPFFVAGVTFIWLIFIPLVQDYLNKYKFISALDGFKKLRDDSSCQLLDIRDATSLGFLCSPNLKIFNKNVVQINFNEANEIGFLNQVKEKFSDPSNTIVCILDNFDGNSMKVAELLFKNGFKEAYAIKGGVRGKKGWQEIQEKYLPPAVHVFRRKKVQKSQKREENGAVTVLNTEQVPAASSDN